MDLAVASAADPGDHPDLDRSPRTSVLDAPAPNCYNACDQPPQHCNTTVDAAQVRGTRLVSQSSTAMEALKTYPELGLLARRDSCSLVDVHRLLASAVVAESALLDDFGLFGVSAVLAGMLRRSMAGALGTNGLRSCKTSP